MVREIYISKISREEIINNLLVGGREQKELHERASVIRDENVSRNVYFRGLIEFSNICKNDCYYCGIRKSNDKPERYSMSKEEILRAVKFCDRAGYGSIVLQSGERNDVGFINFVAEIVKEIKEKFPAMGMTLCVGEQNKATYRRFFEAGAHRYLLRIETSNEEHYKKLHPKEMNFKDRIKCLENLKDMGFQLGTGVMIGSPFQTIENLVDDLFFFKEMDVDMVGMGPFISHQHTPLKGGDETKNFNLSLNMIAYLRILMPDINIAATTALQALHPRGRELGLEAGANVIMPLVTPKKYRENYQLYDNKPCIEESSDECLVCITERIKSVGLKPKFGEKGDSLHYFRRVKNGCAD